MQLAEASYQRDGFAWLPELLGVEARAQLRALTPRILLKAKEWQARGEPLWFLQDNFVELATLLRDPALVSRLLTHSGLNHGSLELVAITLYTRRPGDPGTAWHQDARYIPSDQLSAISLWLPLQAINDHNSPIKFIPGSQNLCLFQQPQPAHRAPLGLSMSSETVATPMAFGDATIHHPWTLHGSRSNRTGENRYALIINYQSAPLVLNAHPNLAGPMHPPVVNALRHTHYQILRQRLDNPNHRLGPSE